MFLYSTVSTLNPKVGTVSTTSSSCNLYNIVVFPALSKPKIKILASRLPKIKVSDDSNLDNKPPIKLWMLLEELLISKWNHIATFTAPEDPLEDENALILTNFQALVLPPSCGIHAPLIYASLNLNDGLTLDEPEPIPSLVIESSVFYITVSASNRHICETFIETLVILNSQIPDLIVTDECLPTHSNTLTLSTFSQGLSGYAEIVAEEIVSNLRKIHQPTLQGSNCVGESENFPNSISAHYTPRDTKLSPNSGQVQALSENLQQTRATKSQFAEGQSLTDHEAKQWCSSGFGRVFGRKTKSATGPIDISWPSLGQSSDQSPSQSAAHKRPRGEKALNRSRFLWFRRKFGRSQKQNTHEREIMAAIRAIATLASIIEYTRSQGCLAIVMDFSTSNTLDDSPRRTNELKRAMILWLTNYLGLGVTPWLISCQAPPSMDLDEKLGQTRSVLRMHAVPEKTVLISPVPLTRGDHVLRQIRSHGTLSYITHHGLYIGQGIIVHFSGNESALRSLIFPDQLSTKLRKVSVTEFMKFGGRIIVQK